MITAFFHKEDARHGRSTAALRGQTNLVPDPTVGPPVTSSSVSLSRLLECSPPSHNGSSPSSRTTTVASTTATRTIAQMCGADGTLGPRRAAAVHPNIMGRLADAQIGARRGLVAACVCSRVGPISSRDPHECPACSWWDPLGHLLSNGESATAMTGIGPSGSITDLKFDSLGTLLAGGTSKGYLIIFDLDGIASGQPALQVTPSLMLSTGAGISGVQWNPRNENEVVCCFGTCPFLHLYNLETCQNEPTNVLSGSRSGINDIAFFNNMVLGVGQDGTLSGWDCRTGSLRQTGHPVCKVAMGMSGVRVMKVSADEELIYTASANGLTAVYDIKKMNRPLYKFNPLPPQALMLDMLPHPHHPTTIFYHFTSGPSEGIMLHHVNKKPRPTQNMFPPNIVMLGTDHTLSEDSGIASRTRCDFLDNSDLVCGTRHGIATLLCVEECYNITTEIPRIGNMIPEIFLVSTTRLEQPTRATQPPRCCIVSTTPNKFTPSTTPSHHLAAGFTDGSVAIMRPLISQVQHQHNDRSVQHF
ncbi:hypothetical protein Pelo_13406 [Pelomyxa schiedti]|nr:hypothetical protein Pelo_13406 [Pelomyxa schiedti]